MSKKRKSVKADILDLGLEGCIVVQNDVTPSKKKTDFTESSLLEYLRAEGIRSVQVCFEGITIDIKPYTKYLIQVGSSGIVSSVEVL